jgi:hypothetical protein
MDNVMADDGIGKWHEEKQLEANAWHNLLLEAVKMEAPQSVIQALKRHLDRARNVGD